MRVKGGTRHLAARDVEMQVISQMETPGSIKPAGKVAYYYYYPNNNDKTRSLEPLLIQ